MGTFVALFHRDGAPASAPLMGRLLAPLCTQGGDGRQVSVSAQFGFGHSAFWTVPEDVGEEQPVRSHDGSLLLLFDGRLDNRDEVIAALGGDTPALRAVSDATVALRAIERWGEEALARFVGPFALCLADLRRQSMLVARDPLGDRTLVYHLGRKLLLVASNEAALLRHPEVSADPDETSVALYFALRPPVAGTTLYRHIRELLPGSALGVGRTQDRSRAFWQPPAERSAWRRPEAEYIEEYREVLATSVCAALRTVGSPAALMSGGLDSTTVVALASAALRASGSPTPLRTISWVFDELTGCDERRWIGSMVKTFELRPVQFPGDGCWPLRNLAFWPVRDEGPERNPYHLLKARAYSEAAARGHRVLLVGGAGDQIYLRWRDAFTSLLREGRAGALTEELWLTWRRWGLRGLQRHGAVRRVGGMVADRVVPGRTSQPNVPPWLSPAGAALVKAATSSARCPLEAPTLHPALSWRTGWSASRERPRAAEFGIDLRDPFRDRRVVEFALRVPPHLLLRDGLLKHIVRAAMRGILPEEVRLRTASTPLLGLYRRGMLEREHATLARLVDQPGAAWRRFVKEGSLLASRSVSTLGGRDQVLLLLPFACASYEMWVNDHLRGVRDEAVEKAGELCEQPQDMSAAKLVVGL
jgi:asparagine synthase (glutamine-hydrolysing)